MRRPRFTGFVLSLACVLLAGSAPAVATDRDSHQPDSALVSELRSTGARIARHAATGQVRFVGGSRERPVAGRVLLGRPQNATRAADRFLVRYGSLFGLAEKATDRRVVRSMPAPGRTTFVRYQQLHRGVPVLGAEITVQVGDAGDVISATGEAAPGLELATQPGVTAAAARAEAVSAIAKARDHRAAELNATAPELWVYDPALLGGRGLPFARLVWRTEVSSGAGDMRELVLVDAQRGNVALHFDQIAHARNRITCDGGGTVGGSSTKYPCTTPAAARTEASAPTGISDVDGAHDFAGHTYDFFFNRFGRDSLDGSGMALVSTVRYCPPPAEGTCPLQNAFWDSYNNQMVYGTGYASADDVVGHELSHGFTQFTSGLFYYYQSGAINEALSDIFGEYIDLTNSAGSDSAGDRWLLGEDLPIGAIRDMETPATFDQPARMKDSLYEPDSFESDGGGVHTNSGVANKAAFLMVDGGSFNGQTISGLGIDKAAAVWYRAATNYLGSASDYADLGSALNQGCSDLIGTTPNQGNGTASPTGAFTAGDCSEVAEAVLATEMALQPTVGGTAAPEAALCPSGTPTDMFFDDLENIASGNWTTETISGGNVWYYPQTTHPYAGWDPTYATSGTTNFWGDDIHLTRDSTIRMATGVTIPSGGFLHFEHAFGFEDGSVRYDGGVLEYQVAAGAWTDAGGLPNVNGYNGTITSVDTNPLGGRQAFTAESHGYISSRYNLSSLAGQNVKFRFRMGTDSAVYDYGWFIDDVRIYACSGGTDTTAPTVSAPDAVFRTVPLNSGTKPVNLRASFTAADSSGITDTTLQQSINGGTFSDMALATSTTTSRDFKATASSTTTRQLRARATDGAANTSAFASGPVFKVRKHQDGSAAVVQSGAWSTSSNSNFYGGTARRAGTAGRSQSITRTATDLAIVSTLGPNRGKAAVYVDGLLQATIDLYSATTVYRQVVYAISFPTAGIHTIELRVLGTKRPASSGTRVDLDAFLSMGP